MSAINHRQSIDNIKETSRNCHFFVTKNILCSLEIISISLLPESLILKGLINVLNFSQL